jgi:hypothetical protein
METLEKMRDNIIWISVGLLIVVGLICLHRDGWNAFPDGKYAPRDGLIQQSER